MVKKSDYWIHGPLYWIEQMLLTKSSSKVNENVSFNIPIKPVGEIKENELKKHVLNHIYNKTKDNYLLWFYAKVKTFDSNNFKLSEITNLYLYNLNVKKFIEFDTETAKNILISSLEGEE